ncbi:MAG: lipo-like protein [Hyphomicrobiales bacterium]|nr:lipo-like protein [Hyphomicrobiales bacterium]
MREGVGQALAAFLTRQHVGHDVGQPTPPELLQACLKPGDVLLVDGNTRISTGIKYLTQSSWSHAAIFVGCPKLMAANVALPAPSRPSTPSDYSAPCFVEADLVGGVRTASIQDYTRMATRICRPIGLTPDEQRALSDFVTTRIGEQYDLKNVIDLARYLLPTPPVPTRFRRKMIALGSGDPTRAICSTLIAQAFQSIRYPILPSMEDIENMDTSDPITQAQREKLLHIRHYSLFTPADFDISPYFQIIKPSIEAGFNFHEIKWAGPDPAGAIAK